MIIKRGTARRLGVRHASTQVLLDFGWKYGAEATPTEVFKRYGIEPIRVDAFGLGHHSITCSPYCMVCNGWPR